MNKRRELIAEVISSKMEKTVVVKVQRTVQHPMYGKVIRQRTEFKAHDEKKECHVGDRVRLVECRPLSKEKHWKVVEVLAHAQKVEPVLDEESEGLA
jgi:small subunit ribosomal protein S17